MVQGVEGYLREMGVSGEYKTVTKEDGFQLIEIDQYTPFYHDYFFNDEDETLIGKSFINQKFFVYFHYSLLNDIFIFIFIFCIFIFYILYFIFYILYFIFYILYFIFYILYFIFYILYFIFYILYFIFW